MGSASAIAMLGGCAEKPDTVSTPSESERGAVNALLISATTNPGQSSLEHARAMIAETFGAARKILLINFASLPQDRDAYAARMGREFSSIGPGFAIESLHEYPLEDCAEEVSTAEGFYVSGGNTFLLLRELYDRGVVGLIQKRALAGIPYIGSSAGSNIGGQVIGTTNDFPLVDIPTRQSLGLFPGVYNPHHPDPALDKPQFDSRQWKINQYVSHNRTETVVGVTNPGMLRIRGAAVSVAGVGATAFVHSAGSRSVVDSSPEGEALTIPVG